MDVTELYATIASGDSPELSNDDLRWVRKPLYEKALREVDASEPQGRLSALHVAAWLGLDRAIAVPAKLVRDADRSVRVSAFNLAVAAGDSGRALLRDVLLGSDAQLAAASLALLGRLQDQAALQSARRHVTHGDPAVQVAAIHVLGLVGGASVRPALSERPGDADAVKDAKAQARAWLDGDLAKPAPTPWWEDGEGQIDTSGTLVGPGVEPLFVATGSTAPPAASPAPPPAAEPEPTALVPSSPTDVAATTAPPADPTTLPDPLPDEPRALAKLYGMVDASAQEALLPHLAALDASALATVWMGWSAGSDPAVGRGIAKAAAALGRTAFLSKARSMARADDAGVRGAAAEALGALGGMSTLTALRPMLTDGDAGVRAATVRALADLSRRVDRESMARSWVSGLDSDEAPEVVAALAAWPAS